MSTTKNEIVKMLRESRHIPANVNENTLGKLVAVERNLAQIRLALKDNSHLSSTIGNIEAGLNQLGNLKSQIPTQEALMTQFAPLKSEAKERIQQRDKLIQDLDASLDNMKEVIPQISEALSQNNPQKAEIGLLSLERAERSLTKTADQLQINEKNLQSKLDILHVRTFQSIPKEDRANLPTPPTLAQEETKRLE